MSTDSHTSIKHAGVKGMRWGVRKDRRGGSNKSSADHTESRASLKKKTKQLSNNDIQALTRRLQLEQSFKQVKAKNHPVTKVRHLLKGALATTTTLSSLYAFAKTPLGKEIAKGLSGSAKKVVPAVEVADYMMMSST